MLYPEIIFNVSIIRYTDEQYHFIVHPMVWKLTTKTKFMIISKQHILYPCLIPEETQNLSVYLVFFYDLDDFLIDLFPGIE